jgi:hypothetical protein
MEKETVRTRVMLRRGDQTPAHVNICSYTRTTRHTTPEAMEALGPVRLAHAVAKRTELVAGKRQRDRLEFLEGRRTLADAS